MLGLMAASMFGAGPASSIVARAAAASAPSSSSSSSCDDGNACTFDWLELQRAGASHPGAAPVTVCAHELIPPPCQPLLVHSNAPPHSSLNKHGLAFAGGGGNSQAPPSAQLDAALDVHVLVSIAGDTELIVQRVQAFLENVHTLTFGGAPTSSSSATAAASASENLDNSHPTTTTTTTTAMPAWSLSIYNQSHTEVLQPLTRCFSCLMATVQSTLFGRIRRMDTYVPSSRSAPSHPTNEQLAQAFFDGAPLPAENTVSNQKPAITTPVGIYTALNQLIQRSIASVSASASTSTSSPSMAPFVVRPYAHQHLLVLDGVGEVAGGQGDLFLRVAGEPSAEELQAHNEALGALLTTISSPALAAAASSSLSYSRGLWFDADHEPFFNASIGSPVHASLYPRDSSHFNSARTLGALIRDKLPPADHPGYPSQASSLQAQLLARQVLTRTHDVRMLEVTFRGQLHHVWETHYRQPKHAKPWCSACQTYKCHPKKQKGWKSKQIKKVSKQRGGRQENARE